MIKKYVSNFEQVCVSTSREHFYVCRRPGLIRQVLSKIYLMEFWHQFASYFKDSDIYYYHFFLQHLTNLEIIILVIYILKY